MRRLLSFVAAVAASSLLVAQNCPERVLGTSLGTGDDVMFAMQPIGFAFPFAGATYTDIHVCTNGYVFLSNAGVPAPGAADFSPTTAEFVSGSPRIAPLWNDFNILPAANGGVYINSSAAKCSVTWDNAVNYAGLNVVSGPIQQFQLQLLPTGEIRFFYSANVTNMSTLAAGVPGICGVTPGGGAVLPAASDLSVTGVTPDNTLFELFATANTCDLGAAGGLSMVPTNPGYVYVPGTGGCATSTNYGTGCIDGKDSFYEFFGTAAAFDLSGRTITMLRQAGGYVVLDSIPGTYVPPSTSAVQIAIGDDVVQTVALSAPMPVAGGTTSNLTVCSNGHIALSATGNGTAYTPVVATLLGWANTVVGNWHDYNQTLTGSGQIKFEEVAGVAYVTWENVYSHTTTSADRWQAQFDVTNGQIQLVFDSMTPAGNAYMVGYSVGGASPDSGNLDLSTALAVPLNVADASVTPLTLSGNGQPWLGNSAFGFNITNVPNLVPIGILFFGDAQLPGLDLGFLGAPNCRAYSNASLASITVPVTLPAGTATVPLAIPNTPGLVGLLLTAQAAAFSTATSLGLVTSNGTQIILGF